MDHYCSPFTNMISKTKMQISTCMMKALIKVKLYVVWKRERQKIIASYSIQAKQTYKIVTNKQTMIRENGR